MRILATKDGADVVIVGFLYKGVNQDTLKAIFIKSDGSINDSDVANFTAVGDPVDTNFLAAVKKLKVKTW